MKEAPITRSPHAFVPKKHYTEQEEAELYRTRLDESFKPYTVIDVITKVFHRSFADDLRNFLGLNPPVRKRKDGDWRVDRIWVNECRVIHPEALFLQPTSEYYVQIETNCRIKIEEVKVGNSAYRSCHSFSHRVWLTYIFNFCPCELTCDFMGATCKEEDTLLAMYPDEIRMDRYLLPVLKRKDDYVKLADIMLKDLYPEALIEDVPVDPEAFIRRMGRYVCAAKFPNNGTLGEYFFDHGVADLVDTETGEIKERRISPGTILYNEDACKSVGSRNGTIMHEGCHARLDTIHFMLQKMHGHDYCSYVCKKFRKADEDQEERRLSPVDIMEIQANTLPGYLMIRENTGKKHAEMLLESYGGKRSLENMSRLVDDMAAYYGTTKHMARTRLMDFGFTEARGLMRSANGGLVPSYISTLKENQTYTIDEADALKEYLQNAEFRETLLTGCYVYVEGHYCLDSAKYVCCDHAGNRHLTFYAREHMAECCLVFETVYESVVTRIINGILQKGVGKGRKRIKYVRADGSSVVTEEGKKLRAQLEKERADASSLTADFNQLTRQYMKDRSMTVDLLADVTGLSVETIKDMRTNPEKVFNIQSIVAVCIALQLPADACREYIDKSPSKFLNTYEMDLYRYALKMWRSKSVAEVNRKLVEAGGQPLTNLVDGFDENGVKIG